MSKLAQQLESVSVTYVKYASPVRDCLISEGVGSRNKKADFVFVDLSKDSPVKEEYGSVMYEVLTFGDELAGINPNRQSFE